MSAENLLTNYAEKHGWNRRSKIEILCAYIDNQQALTIFKDFLDEWVARESCEDDTETAEHPVMRTYEITLKHFDPEKPETEHLVKWVLSPHIDMVYEWLRTVGLAEIVEGVRDLGDHAVNYTFVDGVDVMLDTTGGHNNEVEYLPGRWQCSVGGFSPQTWITESRQEG